MQILEETFRWLFTYSNINKGHFIFRKAYYVITIIIQLIGNT